MEDYRKLKWYEHTGFIAFCFSMWYFIFPLVIGIILLAKQSKYLKLASDLMDSYSSAEEIERQINKKKDYMDSMLERKKATADSDLNEYLQTLNNNKMELELEIKVLNNNIEKLKEEKEILLTELPIIHYDFSDYDGLTSQQCKNELALLRNKTKDLISSDKAITGDISSKSGKSNAKQIIRLFNAECDNVLMNLTVGKIDSSRSKITKSFETINKMFSVDNVELSDEVLKNKLEELNLVYTYTIKEKQEKELQKAIKEQMIEEEKARREIEAAKNKVEKDEMQFNREIKKLLAYTQKTASDAEKQLYIDKIKELEDKLKELEEVKKNVELREANATAGYVYVISNIGSFGDDVYKIGMTRRLEPMDRVKELSSASVPFEFDVHAMIFSDNAPELENALHERFRNNSVNKVNYRKEFFNVSLSEIENIVKSEFNNTAEFTLIPQATEYRETMRINSENK